MMEKYFIDLFEGKFRLYQLEDLNDENSVGSSILFGSYEQLVRYCKGNMYFAEIFDYTEWTLVRINGHEELSFESEMGVSQPFKNAWNEVDEDLEEEVSCTTCHDGGCIHCDPNFFI